MRLVRFAWNGEAKLGIEIGDTVVDMGAGASLLNEQQKRQLEGLADNMVALLSGGEATMAAAMELNRIASKALAEGRGLSGANGLPTAYRRADVHLLAPVHNPQKFILLGANYRSHAEESSVAVPTSPIIFAKYANAINGPYDPIVVPPAAADQVDWEAELAFVIGKRARRVAQQDALEYVAGYMCVNDVSARHLSSIQSQWTISKTPDNFAPMGPCLVTRDEIPDPQNLSVRCLVNGQVMQEGNTGQMIFRIDYLIHWISRVITLEPGDVVSTGTPAGVGFARNPQIFMHEGDVVRTEVGGIGFLENRVTIEK